MTRLIIKVNEKQKVMRIAKHIIRIISRVNACIGCLLCEYVCPTSAIRIKKAENHYKIDIDENKCIRCLLCNNLCPIGVYYEKAVLNLRGP